MYKLSSMSYWLNILFIYLESTVTCLAPKLHKLIQTSPWLLDHLIEARIKERQIQERENRDRIEAAKRRVEF